jgi:hypothetical protein
MFCPNCGSEVKRGRFCINCGAQILDENVSPSAVAEERPTRPERSSNAERAYGNERPSRPEQTYDSGGYAPRNTRQQRHDGEYTQYDDYDDRRQDGYEKSASSVNFDLNSIAAKISPKGPFAVNPVINAFKKLGNSWLFLSFLAIESLFLLTKLIGAFTSGFSNIFGGLYRILDKVGLDGISYYLNSFIGNIFSFLDTIIVVYSLIVLIPSILIGVGIWLTYLECRKVSNKKMKISGMNMINIVVKIRLIIYMVVLAIAEIGIIIWGVSNQNRYYNAVPIGAIVAIMIGVGVFFGVKIFYNKLIIDATSNIIFVMNKASFSKKRCLPNVLEIFNYIIAGLSLFTITMGSVFANVLSIAAIIVISIFMRKYNDEMMSVVTGRPARPRREETYQEEYPGLNSVADAQETHSRPVNPTSQSNSFASSYDFTD